MINYSPMLYTRLLSLGYNVQPEHFVIPTQTPCITYLCMNNSDDKVGDTIRYSNIAYQIKIWGTFEETNEIATQIADLLSYDFQRGTVLDFFENNMSIKIMNFYGKGYEKL